MAVAIISRWTVIKNKLYRYQIRAYQAEDIAGPEILQEWGCTRHV